MVQVMPSSRFSQVQGDRGSEVQIYIMTREVVYIRIVLEKPRQNQPPTPLQTDNTMAESVINSKVQPKRLKAMDVRFHWLQDREY